MAEFSAIIPWIVLLTVFAVMAALVWRGQTQSADLAKVMLELIGQKGPAPQPVHLDLMPAKPAAPPPVALPAPSFLTPKAPAPAPAPAPAAPRPTGPFAGAPPWFILGVHDIGFHETGDNRGIELFIAQAHCGALGDPWCMIWVNAKLEQSGIHGTRSASSQSPRKHPEFVQLPGPALGAIVVFWRGSPDSGLGHVGFYRGEDADRVWTLGGNENDMVQIEALPKSGSSFGLVGYWWPKSVPLPTIAPVLMPTGSPAHVQTAPSDAPPRAAGAAQPGRQTNIIATMFGGQGSAYGGAIDDNGLGVALPFHFTGERPKVRVTGKKSGASVECDIVDVGPWNTNDPYWTTGTRPQAESGTDTRGRHTNGAGIDLSFAAAKALGIDGKGMCDWEFVTASPLAEPSTTPKVT